MARQFPRPIGSPRERAYHAARWKLGAITIDPTTKLAAETFGVSTQLVAAALRDLGVTPPTPVIDGLWASLPAAERDAFVRRNLLAVWDAIDRTTA